MIEWDAVRGALAETLDSDHPAELPSRLLALAENASKAADGAELLDLAHAYQGRYMVFPSPEAADAVVLYAAATHAVDRLHQASRLVIKSPLPRCGKSRLLEVLRPLIHRPLATVNISAAALVRSITPTSPPTLMFDEADTLFGKNARGGDDKAEVMRGIINAGFQRNSPYIRWDAAAKDVEYCPTFCFAVIAGIGDMPDTIEDRAVVLTLRRKMPGEKDHKFHSQDDAPPLVVIGTQLGRWAAKHAKQIGAARPAMPRGLNDRADDVWEGLIAVADIAGGTWPDRARRAAVALSADAEDDAAENMRLLTDLRAVFGLHESLHTVTILERMHSVEGAPWGDFYGHPLKDRELAKLLKPYGVKSTTVTIGPVTLKGYQRASLHDAWSRYAPNVGSVGPVGSQVNRPTDENVVPLRPL